MPNPFVDYLNSMNNADANGKGSLAETQVLSSYFDRAFVARGINTWLRDLVLEEPPQAIILTGHAGDGKTSLLAQLLRSAGCFPEGSALREAAIVETSLGRKLFYVKDMSELKKDRQEQLLQEALDAPKKGISSVLITNTGPLINIIERLLVGRDDAEESTMNVLDRLDMNDGQRISISGKSCRIVNVARLDNVSLGAKILRKVLNPELWLSCDTCVHLNSCPINNNRLTATRRLTWLSRFVTIYYRYLDEQDNRLTVRQMVSHLTFALTGNLACSDIPHINETSLFDYHLGNLFFGYRGLKGIRSAQQIRAITELQKLELDTIALGVDNRLFVKYDFSAFEESVADILEAVDIRFRSIKNPDKRRQAYERFRQAVRRFYILLAVLDQPQQDALLGEIFSPMYPKYLNTISEQLGHLERLDLQDLIFQALYMTYAGTPASGDDEIHLSVRRGNTATQYIQLLKGSVSKNQMTLKQTLINGAFDQDETRYVLEIQFKKLAVPFRINYPLLDHFWRISRGAVNTSLSPALSHGIDRLKAQLVSGYSDEADHPAVNLLVQTSKGVRRVTCELADGHLCVE